MNSKLIYKSLFYFTAITIAVLSLVSLNFNKTAETPGFSFRLDYLFHFAVYFFLALFLILWKSGKYPVRKNFIYFISFGIFYSLIFEIIQIFIPNRIFNPMDVLFNILGFAFGTFLLFINIRILSRSNQ